MISIAQISEVVGGELFGVDGQCAGVKIDSRLLADNDLFVAIPGEKFDGHDYLRQAKKAGAVAALVSARSEVEITQILVEDTTIALGILGKHWRSSFGVPVIGITGSNGKTTVTALVSSILNVNGTSLSPKGSFNNQWGVPLTLLGLTDEHDYLVVEMGMNHAGELDYLTHLVTPDVALITNAAPAHLEGLGSVEKIASAKAEIFNGLTEKGVAILNLDDAFYGYWETELRARKSDRTILSFGRNPAADVVLGNLSLGEGGSRFSLKVGAETIDVHMPLLGEHNAMNAAAAACIALGVGLDVSLIKAGLERAIAVPGRLNLKRGLNEAWIVDDSYNANPASMKAAIDVLSNTDTEQKRVLVLGEMAELGKEANDLHFKVGKYAKDAGVDQFYCLSETNSQYSSSYIEGYGAGARRFTSLNRLVDELKEELGPGVFVVIKGSRSSAMERVVNQVVDTQPNYGGTPC